jgi:hypothetical protein
VAQTTIKRLLCCGFRRNNEAIGQVCQCWWRICREIKVFPRFEYHMFYVLYPFVTYLLTLCRNNWNQHNVWEYCGDGLSITTCTIYFIRTNSCKVHNFSYICTKNNLPRRRNYFHAGYSGNRNGGINFSSLYHLFALHLPSVHGVYKYIPPTI